MTEQREELRDTQVIVDLDKIEENMKLISRMAGTEISVMAVIKANGYGHDRNFCHGGNQS